MRAALFIALLLLLVPGQSRASEMTAEPWLSRGLEDRLFALANAETPMTRAAFEQEVREQWRLARHHDQAMGVNLWQQSSTGFDPAYLQRASLSRTLEQLFPTQADSRWLAGSREALQLQLPDAAELKALIGDANPLGYDLTPSQQERLGKRILAQFPGEGPLNLRQVFEEQSVQGRLRLRQADGKFLQQLLERRVFEYQQRHWLLETAALTEQELTTLGFLVRARQLYPKILGYYGVAAEQHGENPRLTALAAAVTDKEISDFYRQQPQLFRRLEQAGADYWRFDTQAAAIAVRRQLANADPGAPSATGRISLAGAQAQEGNSRDWLTSLAAALPAERLSQAIRSPEGQWLLLRTRAKAFGLYPEHSETVAFIARRKLAALKAKAQWQALRQSLGLTRPDGARPHIERPDTMEESTAEIAAQTAGMSNSSRSGIDGPQTGRRGK
ncbi:peptidyl-prolyl cis-trans isomerase [Shewanella sp. AS16]|uniref:peptidylprolyl isomerase n=1 Tax=Shewanella sp. AS16 TaxID=2907625 RepID=UPI001F3B443B|nr:peptidylprolyl isomerase [Shewanella sp. AS16]MCE9687569.1 peptidyl-prolyl cis-trans isomerase [Shewanella sp. AS16]